MMIAVPRSGVAYKKSPAKTEKKPRPSINIHNTIHIHIHILTMSCACPGHVLTMS